MIMMEITNRALVLFTSRDETDYTSNKEKHTVDSCKTQKKQCC